MMMEFGVPLYECHLPGQPCPMHWIFAPETSMQDDKINAATKRVDMMIDVYDIVCHLYNDVI